MSIFNEGGGEAAEVSRRLFLKLGVAGVAGLGSAPWLANAEAAAEAPAPGAVTLPSYLTPPERFRTFVREKPPIDQFTPRAAAPGRAGPRDLGM
jgi:hypothetical protein